MASARWKLPAWAWSPPTTPSKYGRIVGSWRIPAPTAGKPDARLARNWSGVVWNWAASAGIAFASSSAAMAFTVSMSWRLWASAADRKAGRKSLVRLSTPWVLAGRLMTRLPMAMTRPTTRTMPSAMGLRFMNDSLVRGPMLVVRGSGMTSRSDGDGQVLGRQVLGDALFAALPAEAGVLHTADERLRPAVDRVGNERRHLVPGLLLDERPERHARLGAGADGHPTHPVGQTGGELLGHRLGDEEPVGGGAGLPAVAELRHHRPLDRLVEVGVVEDEKRRVPAELQRLAEAVFGRHGHEPPAGRRRTGERQLADFRAAQ